MEDEQIQQQSNAGIETEVITRTERETKLDNLPRVEEKEIRTNTEIEGATKVEQATQLQDRVFVRKADQKKALYKKRIKIVTTVYTTAVILLLAFVGVNIATLTTLNKDITTNTETIQSQVEQIEVLEQANPTAPSGEYQISLNEPRDYSEDKKELTWLDKFTILFRNLFS